MSGCLVIVTLLQARQREAKLERTPGMTGIPEIERIGFEYLPPQNIEVNDDLPGVKLASIQFSSMICFLAKLDIHSLFSFHL